MFHPHAQHSQAGTTAGLSTVIPKQLRGCCNIISSINGHQKLQQQGQQQRATAAAEAAEVAAAAAAGVV